MRVVRDDLDEQGPAWEGPCMMGDLCGGSHAPEKCSLFMDLSPEDRLVVVQKKRLCYLCFRNADSQPCTLQSLPACSVGGCVRMHSKLLHEALQKEETRAIVIEVEEGPEEPGEDEEFYAANFELLGQEDEDEEEGLESEDEAPPLVDSDGEPDEEPPPFADLGEDRPRLCQQRVPLEVNGNLTSLHTLYDWESANTLVRKESARRIGLQGVRAPRQAIKGYQGEGLITDSVYYLPLLNVDGNIQVIRAYGVDEIAVVARTRLPPIAREIFPVIRAYMPWMETGAGHVELLIGLDNRQWLPAHVEDSWDPDDDMRLMKSVFGYRYMITDGWGRDLLPPDNSQSGQADAQGSRVEAADEAQEVRLEEYRGWSQGTWNRGNSGMQGAASSGDRCLGARPKDRGRITARGAPVAQREASQGGGSRGPGGASRGPPVPPAPFGMPYSQVRWGVRPRPREIPPPKKRPPSNPSPAPGRNSWNRGGSNRGRQGQGRAIRAQQPRRQPPPDPGRLPGPLQLMGPGDPVQKLALMMEVMMLGMPPVNGYGGDMGSGAQGEGGRMEPMFYPSVRIENSMGTPAVEKGVSPAVPRKDLPVVPGGLAALRILQQVQLEMESLSKIMMEIQEKGPEVNEKTSGRKEWNPGSGGSGQEDRPRREAAQKAMDSLKKVADATRGRGRRKGRMCQRAGIRN
jgi:hypothetical protein